MSLNLESKIIVSLMSGTSCDSIDVGLCQVNEDFSCTLIDGLNYNYPEEIKKNYLKFF
jgi:1,6-anhydro-N-acetylmuramate kinase